MNAYFSREPLRLEKLLTLDSNADAGGIVTFVGTPRSLGNGKKIIALEYEAYEEMAWNRLHDLIFEAQMRWPVTSILIQHRLGRVPVGEPSIVVQVRAEHRYEAFCASQFLIDGIKREAPIWKKEIYAGGEYAWVHCDHAGTVSAQNGRLHDFL